MKKIIIIISFVLIIGGSIVFLVFDWGRKENKNFKTINKNFFSISSSSIVVSFPIDNQEVSNPIKIEGKANRSWFFENSFPIQLIDMNENILATTIGQAQGDLVGTDFIDFTATLEYSKSTSSKSSNYGLIILNKSNLSDNYELDQSIFIPVILK